MVRCPHHVQAANIFHLKRKHNQPHQIPSARFNLTSILLLSLVTPLTIQFSRHGQNLVKAFFLCVYLDFAYPNEGSKLVPSILVTFQPYNINIVASISMTAKSSEGL